MFLFSIRVLAQNQVEIETDTIAESIASSSQSGSAPDGPRPQRVVDKKFIFVMGALAAAETLRITSNTMALDRMYAEGAPWVTSAPSHRNMTLKNGAIFASELLVAYELKKPHPWLPGDKVIRKLWWVYPVAMTAVHFRKASHTMGMSAPAGCMSMECH
jgi:hypothetical protein